MLMRSEPFTEVNRLAQQLFGAAPAGTADAFRNGDEFVIAFDVPGVDAAAIDIDVARGGRVRGAGGGGRIVMRCRPRAGRPRGSPRCGRVRGGR